MNETDNLKIDFNYFPFLNLAMVQNKYPVAKGIVIENSGTETLENLTLMITPGADFAAEFKSEIAKIEPGEKIDLTVKTDVNQGFVLQLSEELETDFTVSIKYGDTTLHTQKFPMRVLPAEFYIHDFIPELLASFVTPNLMQVRMIVSRAAKILQEFTGDSTIDGYGSRSVNRVRQMAGAIFEALKEQKIAYILPPADASEIHGQRIRFADEVIENKAGTCVETALLYASCLECARLYPIVIAIHGHAFVGVHLEPETFQDSVSDDLTELTKRLGEGMRSIEVVESTCIDTPSNVNFEEACTQGATHLIALSEFEYFVDVARCRSVGIKPLPRLLKTSTGFEIDPGEAVVAEGTHIKPQEISIYDIPSLTADNKPVTKQTIWERKLLDLSLRNSLLNMRFNKKNLMLMSAGVNKIEDYLSGGEEFRILPRPSEFSSNEDIDFDDVNMTIAAGTDAAKFIMQEIENKRLHSLYSEAENAAALKDLYRNSKSSLEENGANTLYLAIGLLRWYETEKSETPRYAPILLLPIEIIRRNSVSGYVIRSRDEDVIANITLAEMLRQNFGINLGLPDPLPTDESGVDVPKIFAIVRNAIMNVKRWDIEEKAVIGNFSFNKFVMWNDIHSHAELLVKSPIVDSLVNGRLTAAPAPAAMTAEEMDRKYTPADMLLPVSCDSSQLEAVEEAVSGGSFIMFGPPGTGKSQTITNIIANALYRGKRVLFVAQKAAALEVVRTRLDKLGLSPFCLDVFSNKANKTQVLAQLNNCTQVTRYKSPADFEIDTKRLMELRQEFNGIMDATHKKLDCGLSMYDAVSQYIAMGDDVEADIPYLNYSIDTATPSLVATWFDIISEASVICKSIGNPVDHPLNCLYPKEYKPDSGRIFTEICQSAINTLKKNYKSIEDCNTLLKVDNPDSYDHFAHYSKLLKHISKLTAMTAKAASFSDNDGKAPQYFQAIQHGKNASEIRAQILKNFKPEILSQDWASTKIEWEQSIGKFFIMRYFAQKGIKKKLAQYAISANLPDPSETFNLLAKFNAENSEAEKFRELTELFDGVDSDDWATKEQILRDVLNINSDIRNLSGSPIEYQQIKQNFAAMFAQGFTMFKDFYAPKFSQFTTLDEQAYNDFGRLYDIAQLANNINGTNSVIHSEIAMLEKIVANIDSLKDWYIFVAIRRKMDEMCSHYIVDYFDETNSKPDTWLPRFKKSFYKAVVEHVFATSPALQLFKGEIFDEKIKRYRELNDKYMELAKAEIYAKLASNAPDFSVEASKNSEPGILMKNIRSNGRGTSIRTIFDQLPNLLPRLCPCMLMSPMSVAQYLTLTDKPQFDLTIFDEASQMPTSDAVGAIARSKNVIITGDPKQMPPTSFFSSTQTDEENIEVEDLESILDDALALNIKSRNLLWHYRSKHESLITFSNHEYYDNSLLTFPSPDNRTSKVTLVKVDGYYDRSKSRCNPAEAKAVVAEVERRLSDPELSKRSIGIVTFSIVQQHLIDDMLTDLFAQKPNLEAIANNEQEPLFCKNLESVQGDERDVILFSVGYGPDKDGKVSMNFGPLNQKGGERRLNVAVSRARYEMKIFSTLTADMIDTNRTAAVGVAGLKKFLAFAQHGVSGIRGNGDTINNEIAKDISRSLRKKGYESDVQVGCSGFRVDVAVCDPDDKNRYILAILTDSNEPSRTRTARDREICQPSVLKMLGWNVMKVWSVDWYNDRDAVIAKIVATIDNIKSPLQIEDDEPVKYEIKQELADPVPAAQTNPNGIQKRDYEFITLNPMKISDSGFYSGAHFAEICADIQNVVNTESPIKEDYLRKRISEAYFVYPSADFDKIFDSILSRINHNVTIENDVRVIWRSGEGPSTCKYFRTDDVREGIDVPPVEFINAIRYVLQSAMSLPEVDLRRQVITALGFKRTGNVLAQSFSYALRVLKESGEVVEKGGVWMMG